MSTHKNGFTTQQIVFIALFSALITIGAYMRIPIPYIPLTMQPMFALLSGLLLGPRLGAISVAIYVIAGLCGAPVFTGGGGPSYIFHTTFGYLLGFIAGAYSAGKIAHAGNNFPKYKRLLCASFVNMFIVYSVGLIYFHMITSVYMQAPLSLKALLTYGFAITAPSDVIICFIGALIARRLIPELERMGLYAK